ncbi:MAG TPA: hypothetical protein VGC91_14005 [Pyrinomonadaceae bacterium]|jgi:hypothetical protein
MKNIRKLLAATFLTMALTATALAGDMHTPAYSVIPPLPPPIPLRFAEAPGESVSAGDALTEAALLLCHQALSIF